MMPELIGKCFTIFSDIQLYTGISLAKDLALCSIIMLKEFHKVFSNKIQNPNPFIKITQATCCI